MTFGDLAFAQQVNVALFGVMLLLGFARLGTWLAEWALRRHTPASHYDPVDCQTAPDVRLLARTVTMLVILDGMGTLLPLVDLGGQQALREFLALLRGGALVGLTVLLLWDMRRIARLWQYHNRHHHHS